MYTFTITRLGARPVVVGWRVRFDKVTDTIARDLEKIAEEHRPNVKYELAVDGAIIQHTWRRVAHA